MICVIKCITCVEDISFWAQTAESLVHEMFWGLLYAVVAVGELLQYGLQTGGPGRAVSGQFGDDEAEHLGQRRELRLWDHRHRNVLQKTWNYMSIHLIISVQIVSSGRKFTH